MTIVLPQFNATLGRLIFDIPPCKYDGNEIIGIFGHSGTGKSTYVRHVVASLDVDALLIPQEDFLFDHLSARKNIEFIYTAYTGKDVSSIEQKITALASRLDLHGRLGAKVLELSGGERQRTALLVALLINPTVLVLDEPFVGLGAKHNRELRRILLQRVTDNKFTLIVSHSQSMLWSITDEVLLLDQGVLIGTSFPTHESTDTVRLVSEQIAETLGMTNVIDKSINADMIHVKTIDESRWEKIAFWPDDVFFNESVISEYCTQFEIRLTDYHLLRRYTLQGREYAEIAISDGTQQELLLPWNEQIQSNSEITLKLKKVWLIE